MKVLMFVLIVWDDTTGEMLEIIPMSGDNGQVLVTYPHDLIGSMDALHEAIKGYGETLRKAYYFAFSEGHDVTLEGEALDMPNIGDVVISIESEEVEWYRHIPERTPKAEQYVVLPCVEETEENLHDEIQRAVNPVAPRRNVRRPVGAEGADFWGLYRNEKDGTQAWMRDYKTNEAAQSNAARMNHAHKEGKAEVL